MSNPGLTRQQKHEALDAFIASGGNISKAARSLKMNRLTYQNRLDQARAELQNHDNSDTVKTLTSTIRDLERQLEKADEQRLTDNKIRSAIIGLKEDLSVAKELPWVLDAKKKGSAPGVPTLFLSDLHWGEVVDPAQINGVNDYNVALANQRMRTCVERSSRILDIWSEGQDYPGIVLILGGDMISGNIHDELTATNELNTMPTVKDLFKALRWVISTLADRHGHVFVPCVSGNHGRDTNKIWGKDRNATSFDWLLYNFLAMHFEDDKRITFFIPAGSDAYFKIYNHRYLLTHGDQFRGGDGMIGALGPIIRGDHKKRSRNGQIDMAYDTLVMGHWHQDISLRRLIVNGSLKGYDEYAYQNSFGFEPPSQQLWLTHPRRGITFKAAVHVGETEASQSPKTSWVSVPA
jgi:transposase-like protein